MSARARAWPLLALATAAVLPLPDAVFGGRALFYRDIHLAWHPAVASFVRAITLRAWPLWNPDTAFGQPLLADPQWMIAYPPTWLTLVLPAWIYYTLFAVAHLFWSALGTYRLGRRWRCSPVAAVTGACVWCLCGPAVSLVSLYHHFASACWMPWVFLAGERALLAPRARTVLAMAAAMAAQILAGSADMTAMTWLGFAAYAVARLLRRRRPWARRNRRAVSAALAAAALAAGLSALAWLPALEVVSRSGRRALPPDTRTYWSLHPAALLEAWLPSAWQVAGLRPELARTFFEGREPFLASIYLGLAAVPLAAACFAGRRPRRRILGALAAASVLVAFGRHFAAYTALVWLLPPLGILRYPVKAYVLFAWAWALICAQGAEAWRRARGSAAAWALPPALGLLASASALAAAGWLARPEAAALLAPGVDPALLAAKGRALLGTAALGLAATALAFVRWLRPAAGARWMAAAAAVAVADLAVHAAGINPTAPRALYARPPAADVLRRLGAQRIHSYPYTFGGGPRELRFARPPVLAAVPAGWTQTAAAALAEQRSLIPNTPARWGIGTGFEQDPSGLHPRGEVELEGVLPLLDGTEHHTKLLRIGGISHLLSLDERPEMKEVARLPVGLEAPLHVYAVPAPLPLAYAVGSARAEAHAGVLLYPEFDPTAEVIIHPPEEAAAGAPGSAGSVTLSRTRPDQVEMRAELSRAGYVVLLETYDPGWRVRVDGRPQPLLRANTIFCAVRVGAGTHVVEMAYRPWTAAAGGLITLAAGAAAAVLAWRARARRRT